MPAAGPLSCWRGSSQLLRAPVQPCPAPSSNDMKRAASSPGSEPSRVSSNASRPWASPLHIPGWAGEALRAGFLESSGGGSDVRLGLPRQPFWLTGETLCWCRDPRFTH